MFFLRNIHVYKLIMFQTSIFLSSLPAEATELSIRTKVVQSLPHVPSSQLKSIVHVAKTRFVLISYHWTVTDASKSDALLSTLKIELPPRGQLKHGPMDWTSTVNALA